MEIEEHFDPIHPSIYRDGENGVATCTLCGAPFHRPSHLDAISAPNSSRWISRAILLTDRGLNFSNICLEDVPRSVLSEDRTISVIHAELLGRGCFRLTGEGEHKGKAVMVNQVEGNFHAELYTPMHEACFHVLERFLDAEYTAPPPQHGKWTLPKVWDVLRLRLEASQADENLGGGIEGVEELPEPHGYCLVGRSGAALQWRIDLLRADPCDFVPEYTDALLAHLDRLHTSDEPANDAVRRFRKGFEELPQELQDHVLEVMRPGDVALTCNRVLSHMTWRRILSDGLLTPFLWDVDTSLVLQHALSDRAGLEYDYELLVRQLAQPEALKGGGEFDHLPLGLRNRWRIWRVLESMRAGDLSSAKTNLSIFRDETGGHDFLWCNMERLESKL